MSEKVETRLTPRERLTRGLTYSAVGPVDVTRGLLELGVGVGVHSARSTAAELRRRYREGRLAREVAAAQETLAQELAAAQDVVANLPQALQDARQTQRRSKHRLWIIAGIAAAILAGGAVAFSIVRRSSRPEPSPRPPSVEVQPRP
ncbi:cell wall synthesis protein CwsA [Mycobacterium canetti]|uniref:cell wall synthesis protein CwsA n=1 Tax=Mycobacterium canetti TaxID=78331 RepID=UPI0032E481C6